jgi:hypothetical protein
MVLAIAQYTEHALRIAYPTVLSHARIGYRITCCRLGDAPLSLGASVRYRPLSMRMVCLEMSARSYPAIDGRAEFSV